MTISDEMKAQGKKCPDCGKPADTTFWGVCRDCVPDHFAFDDDDGDDGFDEFDDCGLMPNGQCLKAGSEECDWECGRLNR